jgi:hypothetical protein
MKRRLYILVALLCGLAGCAEEETHEPPGVCDHKLADGTCVGVTRPEICTDTYCTSGGSCSKVWYVKQDATGGDGSQSAPLGSLAEAAAKAAAGECIALAAGSYAAAEIRGGVSLLGVGSSRVTVSGADGAALTVRQGSGGLLRGLSLSSSRAALLLRQLQGLRVEQVQVTQARVVGIDARECTGLVLSNVTVVEVALFPSGPDAGPDASPPDAGGDASQPDAVVDASQPDVGPDAGVPDAPHAGDAAVPDMAVDGGYIYPDSAPDAPVPDVAWTEALPDATPVADGGVDALSPSDAAPAPTGGGYGIGIVLGKNTTAQISAAAVIDSATQGVLVHGSTVTLEGSLVADSGRYGVAVDCTAGCSGTTRVSGCTITRNGGVGLLLIGGVLEAVKNDIGHTSYVEGVGRNVHLQSQAEVLLEDNRLHHSEGQGLVVDDVTGKVTGNTVEDNLERGVVLQQVKAPGLLLADNEVRANEGAGVAVLSSTAVTVQGGQVADTRMRLTPLGPLSAQVGDGLQIASASEVVVSGVKIAGNERLGVLIDAAKADIDQVTIDGGEAALVVQNAQLSDQVLGKVTDGSGAAIKAKSPATPYLLNDAELISTLPIPLP